ncbi:hypothetical protein [Halopseudomonas yangmingensis]|uniref:TadE-like protein n=1 Tax=Halopseudomonas yangmingensis TaxID=1720063 RepID=A0A1I4UM34_9GAMM|nr:hypothetical protein [Halopseudomonas yangmingensis]SFM89763.1 hypothetical protein SAMN05216217_1265 [Halopseudomonas yangmingensis]
MLGKPVSFNKLQHGQVLAEFLVTAILVLIPSFILVLTLGKYLESKQKLEVAARYVAWERTVWRSNASGWSPVHNIKSDAVLRSEAQTRIFATREQPIFTDHARALNEFQIDPLLNYHYGQNGVYEPIVREVGGGGASLIYLGATTTEHAVPGPTGALDSAVNSLSSLGLPYFSRFDLGANGAHTATASLSLHNPARMPELASLNLQMSRSVTLVTDSWNAGGPTHVRRRVEGLTPLGMFEPVENVLTGALAIGPFRVARRLELGYIDPDQVPTQYLE